MSYRRVIALLALVALLQNGGVLVNWAWSLTAEQKTKTSSRQLRLSNVDDYQANVTNVTLLAETNERQRRSLMESLRELFGLDRAQVQALIFVVRRLYLLYQRGRSAPAYGRSFCSLSLSVSLVIYTKRHAAPPPEKDATLVPTFSPITGTFRKETRRAIRIDSYLWCVGSMDDVSYPCSFLTCATRTPSTFFRLVAACSLKHSFDPNELASLHTKYYYHDI